MKSGYFSISDFARFSRTTRDTLLYYDRIGLLSPHSRGANNYRKYTCGQLAVINVIRTLQELGMSIDEIRRFMDRRTPETCEDVFANQVATIEEMLKRWGGARELLLTFLKQIHSVADADVNEINIRFLPAEPILLGGVNDYSDGRDSYDALYSFYNDVRANHPGVDMNYPVWGIFSKERVTAGDTTWPDRYYMLNPECRDRRPAGLYAIGYAYGGYGKVGGLYGRILEYISANGFVVTGDAYEEYPLNEVCVADDNEYLARVIIAVSEKPK